MTRIPVKFSVIRAVAACFAALILAGCGGGGGGGGVIVVDNGPPPIAQLAIQLVRIGPQTIEVDWGADPLAVSYLVERDGSPLAHVATDTLIDDSVLLDQQYCYRVSGYSPSGTLVSTSRIACLTLFP